MGGFGTEMQPELSIVTVCRNAERTIADTLRSVANQVGVSGRIEHIVVDGASTDNTLNVVKDFPTVRWISEPDRGISDAFNKGIRISKGNWILLLNADDHLADDRVLTDILPHLESTWDVVYGKKIIVDAESGAALHELGTENAWRYLHQRMTLPHPALFMRRDYFDRYGEFSVEFKIAMDYELLLRGYKCIRFHHVPRVVTRMLTGGISHRAILQRAAEMLKAKKKNAVGRTIPNLLHYAYQCVRPVADRTLRDIPLIGRVYRRLISSLRRGF